MPVRDKSTITTEEKMSAVFACLKDTTYIKSRVCEMDLPHLQHIVDHIHIIDLLLIQAMTELRPGQPSSFVANDVESSPIEELRKLGVDLKV